MSNPEIKDRWQGLSKLLVCVAFSFLYSLGGEHGISLAIRRFLAPGILVGAMVFYTRNLFSLITLPLMFASLSIGYGADLLWWKVVKRGYCGLANGLASSTYNGIRKRWLLFWTQIVLCPAAYIVFGVFNPFGSARIEEMVLGFIIAFVPLMSARK